jgi:molecular chaperone HscB
MNALEAQVQQARRAALERCASLIDTQRDFVAAAQQVRALMFIARFAKDIVRRQDQLGQ